MVTLKNRGLKCVIVIVLYLFWMVSCTGNGVQISATERNTPTRVAGNLTRPADSTDLATSSRLVETPQVDRLSGIGTATPLVATLRATATLRPTATVTPTPLPTVPPDQVQTILAELGRNEGDCALPCWWGMTPGIGRWAEYEPFLLSIAKITKERWYNPQVTYYNIIPNLPEPDNSFMKGALVGVLNGIVDSIDTKGTSDCSEPQNLDR